MGNGVQGEVWVGRSVGVLVMRSLLVWDTNA